MKKLITVQIMLLISFLAQSALFLAQGALFLPQSALAGVHMSVMDLPGASNLSVSSCMFTDPKTKEKSEIIFTGDRRFKRATGIVKAIDKQTGATLASQEGWGIILEFGANAYCFDVSGKLYVAVQSAVDGGAGSLAFYELKKNQSSGKFSFSYTGIYLSGGSRMQSSSTQGAAIGNHMQSFYDGSKHKFAVTNNAGDGSFSVYTLDFSRSSATRLCSKFGALNSNFGMAMAYIPAKNQFLVGGGSGALLLKSDCTQAASIDVGKSKAVIKATIVNERVHSSGGSYKALLTIWNSKTFKTELVWVDPAKIDPELYTMSIYKKGPVGRYLELVSAIESKSNPYGNFTLIAASDSSANIGRGQVRLFNATNNKLVTTIDPPAGVRGFGQLGGGGVMKWNSLNPSVLVVPSYLGAQIVTIGPGMVHSMQKTDQNALDLEINPNMVVRTGQIVNFRIKATGSALPSSAIVLMSFGKRAFPPYVKFPISWMKGITLGLNPAANLFLGSYPFRNNGNETIVSLFIPANPSLVGLRFVFHALVADRAVKWSMTEVEYVVE